jgi:hypothetical protein
MSSEVPQGNSTEQIDTIPQIPIISDLKDIVGTYISEEEYKILMKNDPENYTESKLIKNTFSSLPISLILKINNAWKQVDEIINDFLLFINTNIKDPKVNFLCPKYNRIDPEFVFGLILAAGSIDQMDKYFENESFSNRNFDFPRFKRKIVSVFKSDHIKHEYYIYNIIMKCKNSIPIIAIDCDEFNKILSGFPELNDRYIKYIESQVNSNNFIDSWFVYHTTIESENLYYTNTISNELILKYLDVCLKNAGF